MCDEVEEKPLKVAIKKIVVQLIQTGLVFLAVGILLMYGFYYGITLPVFWLAWVAALITAVLGTYSGFRSIFSFGIYTGLCMAEELAKKLWEEHKKEEERKKDEGE